MTTQSLEREVPVAQDKSTAEEAINMAKQLHYVDAQPQRKDIVRGAGASAVAIKIADPFSRILDAMYDGRGRLGKQVVAIDEALRKGKVVVGIDGHPADDVSVLTADDEGSKQIIKDRTRLRELTQEILEQSPHKHRAAVKRDYEARIKKLDHELQHAQGMPAETLLAFRQEREHLREQLVAERNELVAERDERLAQISTGPDRARMQERGKLKAQRRALATRLADDFQSNTTLTNTPEGKAQLQILAGREQLMQGLMRAEDFQGYVDNLGAEEKRQLEAAGIIDHTGRLPQDMLLTLATAHIMADGRTFDTPLELVQHLAHVESALSLTNLKGDFDKQMVDALNAKNSDQVAALLASAEAGDMLIGTGKLTAGMVIGATLHLTAPTVAAFSSLVTLLGRTGFSWKELNYRTQSTATAQTRLREGATRAEIEAQARKSGQRMMGGELVAGAIVTFGFGLGLNEALQLAHDPHVLAELVSRFQGHHAPTNSDITAQLMHGQMLGVETHAGTGPITLDTAHMHSVTINGQQFEVPNGVSVKSVGNGQFELLVNQSGRTVDIGNFTTQDIHANGVIDVHVGSETVALNFHPSENATQLWNDLSTKATIGYDNSQAGMMNNHAVWVPGANGGHWEYQVEWSGTGAPTDFVIQGPDGKLVDIVLGHYTNGQFIPNNYVHMVNGHMTFTWDPASNQMLDIRGHGMVTMDRLAKLYNLNQTNLSQLSNIGGGSDRLPQGIGDGNTSFGYYDGTTHSFTLVSSIQGHEPLGQVFGGPEVSNDWNNVAAAYNEFHHAAPVIDGGSISVTEPVPVTPESGIPDIVNEAATWLSQMPDRIEATGSEWQEQAVMAAGILLAGVDEYYLQKGRKVPARLARATAIALSIINPLALAGEAVTTTTSIIFKRRQLSGETLTQREFTYPQSNGAPKQFRVAGETHTGRTFSASPSRVRRFRSVE